MAATSTSARWRRRVTRRQNPSAEPVTRWPASSGPHVQRAPSGPSRETWNGSAGGARSRLGEAEVAAGDADVGDVPEPAGGFAANTQSVGDVLAVGPYLHQASGHHAGGA